MRGVCLFILVCLLRGLSAAAELPETQPTTSPSVPLGSATLVTIDVHNQPLSAVLEQYCATRECRFALLQEGDSRQAMPSITLSAQAKPFWEVINNICLQCNGDCVVTSEGHVQVRPGATGVRSIATVAGPLQVTVVGVEHLCDLTAADPEYCAVSIRALCEPKLQALYYQNAMVASIARDENGLWLIPAADAQLDDPAHARSTGGMSRITSRC